MNIQKFKKGQIWWLRDTTTKYNEHIQGGTRPVIIISNNLANRFSNNLTVIPCTSAEKKELPTHVKLEINGPSIALCEMITTVSNTDIMNYIGTCDDELLNCLDNAILIALGLDYIKNKTEVTNNDINNIKQPIIHNEKRQKKRVLYTLEYKQQFISDYNKFGSDYMLKHYNLPNKRALQQKAYVFKKSIKEGEIN